MGGAGQGLLRTEACWFPTDTHEHKPRQAAVCETQRAAAACLPRSHSERNCASPSRAEKSRPRKQTRVGGFPTRLLPRAQCTEGTEHTDLAWSTAGGSQGMRQGFLWGPWTSRSIHVAGGRGGALELRGGLTPTTRLFCKTGVPPLSPRITAGKGLVSGVRLVEEPPPLSPSLGGPHPAISGLAPSLPALET